MGGESGADGCERAAAVEAAGGDNGADVSVDLGAPVRSKAICNFSEYDRGPERPLRCVVGRLDIAAAQEDEELVAGIDDDGVSQMAALGVDRLELKQAVELA